MTRDELNATITRRAFMAGAVGAAVAVALPLPKQVTHSFIGKTGSYLGMSFGDFMATINAAPLYVPGEERIAEIGLAYPAAKGQEVGNG